METPKGRYEAFSSHKGLSHKTRDPRQGRGVIAAMAQLRVLLTLLAVAPPRSGLRLTIGFKSSLCVDHLENVLAGAPWSPLTLSHASLLPWAASPSMVRDLTIPR
jgi:hypothetical protein